MTFLSGSLPKAPLCLNIQLHGAATSSLCLVCQMAGVNRSKSEVKTIKMYKFTFPFKEKHRFN